MPQLSHALLDACPGALCLVSPDDGVMYANLCFLEFFPDIHPSMDMPQLCHVLQFEEGAVLRPGIVSIGIQVSTVVSDGRAAAGQWWYATAGWRRLERHAGDAAWPEWWNRDYCGLQRLRPDP